MSFSVLAFLFYIKEEYLAYYGLLCDWEWATLSLTVMVAICTLHGDWDIGSQASNVQQFAFKNYVMWHVPACHRRYTTHYTPHTHI